jgi:hypothetical protein
MMISFEKKAFPKSDCQKSVLIKKTVIPWTREQGLAAKNSAIIKKRTWREKKGNH